MGYLHMLTSLHVPFTPPGVEWVDQLLSFEDLFPTLHHCRVRKDLPHAKLLHVQVCEIGLEAQEALGNHLVPLFVDCGSLQVAQQVFNKLNDANKHSWTSLIQGYAESGELQHALGIYTSMQENSMHPNRHIFVALLKACSMSICLDYVWQLHADIVREDFHLDLYVGNTLVDMYAKHGLIRESRDVLDGMPLRDVVSWTALMAAYNEHGSNEEALHCMDAMQIDGVQPNSFTFVSALKACSTLGYMEKGQDLHDEIVMKGFDGDLFVANTLVDLYASHGSILEALKVFDKVEDRDVVSWNALIAGYAKHGLEEDAMWCIQEMQVEGVSPIPITFILTLKVCGSKGVVRNGQEVHMDVVKRGLETSPSVGNSLVDMYAKRGAFPESWDVFDKLQVQEEVAWNILIASYAEEGLCEEALICLEQMQTEGVCPDVVTYSSALYVCGHTKAIHRGRSIHAELMKKGIDRDNIFVGNTLVDMYAKFGLVLDSQNVFDSLQTRDVVSWNTLITGYADNGHDKESLHCLERMQMEGMCPDSVTYACSLRACGRLGCIDRGQDIHMGAVKQGIEKDSFLGSSLVDMYAKCGSLAEAHGILKHLPTPNVVSWTALISGYINHGLCAHAFDCFIQMQLAGVVPDVPLWNAVILGYAEHGEPIRVLQLYAQLLEQALLPSMTMFISTLKACGNAVALEAGRRFHAITYTVDACDTNLAHALIDMYNNCGSMADVHRVFDAMPSKNLSTWNALMTAYAHSGEYEGVFSLLERTKQESVPPDEITFLSLLSVCSHAGLVDKGREYFCAMIKEYDIARTIKHYSCIVDLLCRVGHFTEALELMEKMPFEPDYALWCTMLGACRRWGNIELGKQMFDRAVRLGTEHDAAYMLMYNIYVDAHMWEEAKAVEALILELQDPEGVEISKMPAMSSWHEDISSKMQGIAISM